MTCKGRFIFSRELGSGSFGQVYLAYDLNEGQFVAIKNVLNNRFAREEVKILKELQDSPGYVLRFVKQFIFNDDSGLRRTGITTEYCDNGDLQGIIESGTGISQGLKRQWLLELSKGVQYIHSKDIVHRDIKPQNILVDYYNRLRIGDVGLAVHCRGIGENLYCPRNSRFASYVSELAGTQPYMAPEVFNEHYNDRSDVYSLGLVFIMILERPKKEYPYAVYKCKKYSLGELQHKRKLAKSPLKYLTFPIYNSSDQEVLMINAMLASDYHPQCRLDSAQVAELVEKLSLPLEYIEDTISHFQAGKATRTVISH